MINELTIKGFKCFDEVSLQMKPITLLAGQNSIGKSTIIHSLLAIKQGGKHPFKGKYMSIGNADELMNAYIGSDEIFIQASFVDSKEKEQEASVSVQGLNAKVAKSFGKYKSNVIYCSAERIGVQDVYEKPIDSDSGVGNNCEYAFAYLADTGDLPLKNKLFIYDDDTLETLNGQVNYWLDEILGYNISAEIIEKTDLVRVFFRNNNMLMKVRPKNLGTGVTYIAEVIISAFSCKPNDLLIVENPEIHLHPSAQSKFVEFLAFLASCGVQIVIETHSDHIYNGLRRCVHEDLIDPEEVGIFFFKQKENNCSVPISVPITSEGKATVKEEGFFDQIKKDLDVILGW